MKRGVLQLILQGVAGDMMAAIEQVLNNHDGGASNSGLRPPKPSTDTVGAVTHRPYMTTSTATLGASAGLKSAFSPISSLTNPQPSPLRYAYPTAAAAAARGLALAMPYPAGFMPSLATLGYPAYSALSQAQKSALSYSLCSCPYGTTPTDKWTT